MGAYPSGAHIRCSFLASLSNIKNMQKMFAMNQPASLLSCSESCEEKRFMEFNIPGTEEDKKFEKDVA